MLAAARPILLCGPLLLALTCATAPPNPNAAKYPPRGLGCKVLVFHEGAPGVAAWEDLGVAHVDCPLDVGRVQCLKKLREEACRMGGDILYDVPKKPMRPTDQGMVYAGHVAHSKVKPEEADQDDEAAAGTEAESPSFDASGPVEPIVPATPPVRDGGVADGGR
jgi:hypothetical protein